MRTTTKYKLVVPNVNSDPDDIPTQVGALADQLDGLITSFTDGSYAAIPAAGVLNRYYYVSSGTTNAGLLYRDTGSAWQQVTVVAGATGDVTTIGWGDAPALGTPSKGFAPSDHRHGSQANPVIAHVAASNPHTQYLLATQLIANFTVPFHIANAMTTGLKVPKWVATQACTMRLARAVLNSGSGTKYQVYKNGAAPTGMVDSPSAGAAFTTHDFVDFAMAVGDYIQIEVTAAGTGADLSITIDGVWAGPS